MNALKGLLYWNGWYIDTLPGGRWFIARKPGQESLRFHCSEIPREPGLGGERNLLNFIQAKLPVSKP